MNDLGRRWWIAKEHPSPAYVVMLEGIGVAVLVAGYVMHRSFVMGAGFGLIAAGFIFLPAVLRSKRSVSDR